MTAIARYFDTYRDHRDVCGSSVDPDWLREHLRPKPPGPKEIQQAHLSHIAVEDDREQSRG